MRRAVLVLAGVIAGCSGTDILGTAPPFRGTEDAAGMRLDAGLVSDAACTGAGCDAASCAGAGCDASTCSGAGCDAGACSGAGCDAAGCSGAGCDAGACSGAGCDAGAFSGAGCDAAGCSGAGCDAGACSGAACDAGACSGAGCDAGACTGAGCDGGAPLDAGLVDAGSADSGVRPDAGECGLGDPGPADKARVLLVAHPFGAMVGVRGTEIQGFSISAQGMPVANGRRLDVGFAPERIAFTPNGAYALLIGERGALATVSVAGAGALAVVGRGMLPGAGYSDLIPAAEPGAFHATSTDVGATSGIVTIRVDCAGSIAVDMGAFHNIRLADSLALLGATSRAVLLGGQAVFAPVDANDIRLLERTPSGWRELNAFDVFQDAIDSGHIAASPDGLTVIVPNGSPFSREGGQIAVLGVQGDMIRERVRLMNLPDARETLFSPDGTTALVARGEPGRVSVLQDRGTGWAVVDEIRGVGLADQMALIARGPLAGHVYVSSTDSSSGPNIAVLEIRAPGMVADLGQLALGMANPNIPGAVAVTP